MLKCRLPQEFLKGFLHTGKCIFLYTPGKVEGDGAEIEGFSKDWHGKGAILQRGERNGSGRQRRDVRFF